MRGARFIGIEHDANDPERHILHFYTEAFGQVQVWVECEVMEFEYVVFNDDVPGFPTKTRYRGTHGDPTLDDPVL